jgi:hypothetical protein
MSGLNFA